MGVVPAQAHNSFTGSSPKNGARVTETPRTVTLSFLAKLDPNSTEVTVAGPDAAPATDGKPVVAGNKVSIGVLPGAAGVWTVAYRVVSVDGHPVKGTISFTVTKGVTPTRAAPTASVAAPSAGQPSAAPVTTTRSAVALESVAGEDEGTAWWPWLLGAVVLLVAAAAGTFLVRRRT